MRHSLLFVNSASEEHVWVMESYCKKEGLDQKGILTRQIDSSVDEGLIEQTNNEVNKVMIDLKMGCQNETDTTTGVQSADIAGENFETPQESAITPYLCEVGVSRQRASSIAMAIGAKLVTSQDEDDGVNEDVKHDMSGNYNENIKETHRSSTLVEPATNKSTATVHQAEHQC